MLQCQYLISYADMTEPTFKETFFKETRSLLKAAGEHFEQAFVFAVDQNMHGMVRLMVVMDTKHTLDLDTCLMRCMTAKNPNMFDTLWIHRHPKTDQEYSKLLGWAAMCQFDHAGKAVVSKTTNWENVASPVMASNDTQRQFVERIKEEHDIEMAQREQVMLSQHVEASRGSSVAPKKRM